MTKPTERSPSGRSPCEIPEDSLAMKVWKQTEDMLALFDERNLLRDQLKAERESRSADAIAYDSLRQERDRYKQACLLLLEAINPAMAARLGEARLG